MINLVMWPIMKEDLRYVAFEYAFRTQRKNANFVSKLAFYLSKPHEKDIFGVLLVGIEAGL